MKSPRIIIPFIAVFFLISCSTVRERAANTQDPYAYLLGDYSVDAAKTALENGTAKLLILGGIAPVVVIGQEKFKEKYGVDYYDFGCLAECSKEEMIAYNQVIFEWLDAHYGKKWRKEVREDVVGVKNWIRLHPFL